MEGEKDSIKTAKTAILNTVANCISLLVGMIMIPIITRVLSVEQMGIANTFISTRNTFVIIITCAVYAYVHRAMIDFSNAKKEYIFSIIIFCFVSVGISFGVCYCFKSQFMELFSLDNFLFYWLFVSCLVFALYSIADYYCIFQNKMYVVALIVLSVGPVSQFLSVGLSYVFGDNKYIGRVIGLDFVYMITAICLCVWMCVGKKVKFRAKYVTKTLKFSIPIIPHLLSQMVLTQCDLLMISYFCGEGKSGIYSMGHTVGFLALTVMSQIMASWSPWVYRRMNNKEYDMIYKNSELMIVVGSYISMGLLTISTELIRIFLTTDYVSCIYIVPILVVAMYFQFIYIFIYDIEFFEKKTKYIAAASICAAVFNIITNYIFIPRYGYIAAGFTTVASYFVLLMINCYFALKLGMKKMYNIKKFVSGIIVVVGYAILCAILRDLFWLRYVIFALITGGVIKFHFSELKGMLKILKKQ